MKIKNKIVASSLLGLLNLGLFGCGMVEKDTKEPIEEIEFETIVNTEENNESDAELVNNEEDVISNIGVEIENNSFITANTDVVVRSNTTDGEKLGTLASGCDIENLGLTEDGYYKVNWYGEDGFINQNYVVESTKCEIVSPIEKILYVPTDIKMVIPTYLSSDGLVHEVTIPKNECLEVYDEVEDYYLVSTNEYTGYIEKYTILQELKDTFVVVDISDQELKLYKDNEVIMTCPVVTGKPSTPTTEGLFSIYDISYSRYLIGPNYRSYVDIMMKFNGGEGLHDAEYHTCDKSHGWRSFSEFGGSTYLSDGSHGCVNMLHDDVFNVSDYVELGTKVLIKK